MDRNNVPDEELIFAWLNQKYVQRADERQRAMNLQYMDAETHDLSASLHRWLSSLATQPKDQTNDQ